MYDDWNEEEDNIIPYAEWKSREDVRLGKTIERIVEEEIDLLIDTGKENGLMGEDVQRILTRLLNKEKDLNRDKFNPFRDLY